MKGKISKDNPKYYKCRECQIEFTHFDNHMIILKDELWNSIAKIEEVLCDGCLAERLGRKIEIDDLWVYRGKHTPINSWYIAKICSEVLER